MPRKNRVPLRAVVVVGLAWVVALTQVIFGGLLGVGFIPIAPLTLMGGVCLLASAHDYAQRAIEDAARITEPDGKKKLVRGAQALV